MQYFKQISSKNQVTTYALTQRDIQYLILIEPKFKDINKYGMTTINSNNIHIIPEPKEYLNLPALVESLNLTKILPMIPPYWTHEDKLETIKLFSSLSLQQKIKIEERLSLLTDDEGNELCQYAIQNKNILTLEQFNGLVLIETEPLDKFQEFKDLIQSTPKDKLLEFAKSSILRDDVKIFIKSTIES